MLVPSPSTLLGGMYCPSEQLVGAFSPTEVMVLAHIVPLLVHKVKYNIKIFSIRADVAKAAASAGWNIQFKTQPQNDSPDLNFLILVSSTQFKASSTGNNPKILFT